MQPNKQTLKKMPANVNFTQGDTIAEQALPVFKTEQNFLISRWKLSWLERVRILLTGYLWLTIHGHAQPPVRLDTEEPTDLL